jgi:hypothetical protein
MSNSLPALILALTTLSSGALEGQTAKALEICGAPFHLGMTRQEVKDKLVLPPLPPVGREEVMHSLFGGDSIMLSHIFFGLPEATNATAHCF